MILAIAHDHAKIEHFLPVVKGFFDSALLDTHVTSSQWRIQQGLGRVVIVFQKVPNQELGL
jgi:hypothetical protein